MSHIHILKNFYLQVNPKEILLTYYPDGPPHFPQEDEVEMFEGFESEPVLV